MATRITDVGKIPYNSPGTYFREIDLTVVSEEAGEFRAAQIGLFEKGPAFEINMSNNYTERAFKMGELNPKYPTSYFAKQYLEQAEGFKEVRLLGLEGYSDSVAYAIKSFDKKLLCLLKERKTSFTGLPAIEKVEVDDSTYNPTDELFELLITYTDTSELRVLCSLRETSKDYILRKFGDDPLEVRKGGSDIFPLWVDFIIPSVTEKPYDYYNGKIKAKNYYSPADTILSPNGITLIDGDIGVSTMTGIGNPLQIKDVDITTDPEVILIVEGNEVVNLTTNPNIVLEGLKSTGSTNYFIELNGKFVVDNPVYNAGSGTTSFKLLSLDTGDYVLSNQFTGGTYAKPDYLSIFDGASTFEYDIFHVDFAQNNVYVYLTGNLLAESVFDPITADPTDKATPFNVLGDNISFMSGNSVIELFNTAVHHFGAASLGSFDGQECTIIELLLEQNDNSFFIPDAVYYSNQPSLLSYTPPTWEAELLDFSDQRYLTPVTPWVVSELDKNGDFKRLFRFWSFNDGKSANTEVKVEINNINPKANNGKGSFNVLVRLFNGREDGEQGRLETFSNLTLDPKSDNYILRRIGDGEDFPLRSNFLFVEMNTDEELEDDEIPAGCLGYPILSKDLNNDFLMPEMPWTVGYDKTTPITKQVLGLANNNVNMRKKVTASHLSYKATQEIGKGFHLNLPDRETGLREDLDSFGLHPKTDVNNTFVFASNEIYLDIKGKKVAHQEQVRRNKFTICFYGGFDGWNVYNERTWDDPNSKDYEAIQIAASLFTDNEILDTDFSIIVTPDLNIVEHANACRLIDEMVAKRDDAVYIPDLPYDVDADPQAASDLVQSSPFLSNRNAFYHPWVQISDEINKVNKWIPPSIIALGTVAKLGNEGQVWNPPGGEVKTVVNNMLRARKRMVLEDREVLFKANINPIAKFNSGNYEIVGVRTTQQYLSALSFLHNRLLLNYAKKALRQTLRALLFTMNNEQASDQFIIRVSPIFERIKRLNGLAEFKVSTRTDINSQKDKTTLYGVVEIVPLYPIERIIVDFQLTDGELNFDQ